MRSIKNRRQGIDWWQLKKTCDLWTAAFFMPLEQEDALHLEAVPTTATIPNHLQSGSAYPLLVGQAVANSLENKFFHWPLEFPNVFERGGSPPPPTYLEGSLMRDHDQATCDVDGLPGDVFRIW